jgi:hypothetical protein
MRQKLDTSSTARIDARCPVDTGSRRHQDVAGPTGQADARRRPRLTGAPDAQRRRKSRLAPLIRRGAPTLVEAGPDVVDDFPTAIPVTPRERPVTRTKVNKSFPQVIDDFPHPIPGLERELDAIEMYLGPLIDKMLQP